MDFWKQEPKFYIPLKTDVLKTGEDLLKEQLYHLGSALLIDDYDPHVEVDTCPITGLSNFIFPKGALISGSFVMYHVAKLLCGSNLEYDDIDIYFKSKADAEMFANTNIKDSTFGGFQFSNPMCAYGHTGKEKINLIYGVEYDSPAHLISRFDIRACSMAIDPNSNTLYAVRGAARDATTKDIVFNPVPRGVTVRRLAKYFKKGFEIKKHQSLFFVELVRSPIYSPELELMTKEY